jgi:hypothetical protein
MSAPIFILRFLRQTVFIRRTVHCDDADSLSLDDLVFPKSAIQSLLGIFSNAVGGGISAVRRKDFLNFLQTTSELFRCACATGGPGPGTLRHTEDLFKLDAVAVALGELGMDMASEEWVALKEQLLQSVKSYIAARAAADPVVVPGFRTASSFSQSFSSSSTSAASSDSGMSSSPSPFSFDHRSGPSEFLVPFEANARTSPPQNLLSLPSLPPPADQRQPSDIVKRALDYDDDRDDATDLCSFSDLESMSRDDLYTLVRSQGHRITKQGATIVKRDMRIVSLSATCKTFKQKSRRLDSRLQIAIATAKAPRIDDDFQISRIGSRNLTPQGTLALGLRRNLGNLACADLGHVILQDMDGTTVSRAEKKTGAALMASARFFFSQLRLDLFGTQDKLPFNLAVHSFRTDGTNSSIWQRRKLYALELESAFLVEAIPDHGIESHTGEANHFILQWPDMFEHIKRVSDILPVEDGSGPGTVALIMKQLQALGCPTWQEIVEKSDSDSVARCP